MLTNDVIIKQSKIHGNGVFANRDFKEGKVVFRWDTSVKLTFEQIAELSDEKKKYITSMEAGVIILLQSPERYVNHSCSPNLQVHNYCDVAIRDIAKGEELTANYTKENIPDLYFLCNCQSVNCRRVIHN